jgi:hemerythrin superfamily protein
MNAIKLLKTQHKEVDALFAEFEKAENKREKKSLFEQIADKLAIHASIEERHFYPEVRVRSVESELAEAYDEHLAMKKLILECMKSMKSPGFDGQVAALMGAVRHHVEEEENELFPKVEKMIEPEILDAIGDVMEAETKLLEGTDARKQVKVETEQPANVLGH